MRWHEAHYGRCDEMEVFQRGEETTMSRGKQTTRLEEMTGMATTGETQSPDFSGQWQPAARSRN